MMGEPQQIRLAPLGGLRSERVSDHTLGDVSMRGSFNVECVDGEWWVRKGEDAVLRRIGSTQWTWIGVGNAKWIIANPYWALQLNDSNPSAGVTNLYSPSGTDTVTLANMSDAATCAAYTPAVGELLLLESGGYTDQVYRVVAASGTSFTLERPFEGDSAAYDCRFIPQIAQAATGTATGYNTSGVGEKPASYVVFEQLVGHTATSVHGSSPAVTAGRRYLIITSSWGTPVAIDLGTVTTVKRNWFFRTHLGSGSETNIASTNGYGQWASSSWVHSARCTRPCVTLSHAKPQRARGPWCTASSMDSALSESSSVSVSVPGVTTRTTLRSTGPLVAPTSPTCSAMATDSPILMRRAR